MTKTQKNWRDEQRKAGKKLLSFWFNPEDIERIETLMNRLDIRNRADVIRRAVNDLYIHQGKKEDLEQDRIGSLEKRVDDIEVVIQKKPALFSSTNIEREYLEPVHVKKWPPAAASYNPDEVKRILIEMDDQEASNIAKHLNDRGFTTVRGLWWSVNTVNKARHKIRNNQWVD